jgi:hypothetical protein
MLEAKDRPQETQNCLQVLLDLANALQQLSSSLCRMWRNVIHPKLILLHSLWLWSPLFLLQPQPRFIYLLFTYSFIGIYGNSVNFICSTHFIPNLQEYISINIQKFVLLEGSKLVTREQKQTAWALWLKNLAEMLEPHLAEIKHQRESKLQHSEPLAHRKLLHATLHWEHRRAATRQILAPNLLGRHSADQQVSTKHHAVFPQPPLG